MKQLSLIVILINYSITLLAQKVPLDSSVYDNWQIISGEKISPDGKYVEYTVETNKSEQSLVIQATDNSWKKEITNSTAFYNPVITKDSHFFIFSKSKDSLGVLELGSKNIKFIQNVSSFKTPKENNCKWMTYQLSNPTKDLVLHNLYTGEEKKYPSVIDYFLNDNSQVLLLQTESFEGGAKIYDLVWINLDNGKETVIRQGSSQAHNFHFDINGNQLAFVSEETELEQKSNTIWLYKPDRDSVVILVNNRTPGMNKSLVISNDPILFSKDGTKLFFTLTPIYKSKNNNNQPNITPQGMDIWNYKDELLQSQQLKQSNLIKCKVVININRPTVIHLTENNEEVIGQVDQQNGNSVLITTASNYAEMHWRQSARPSYYLVNTCNGFRKTVKLNLLGSNIELSPEGKYVIYYDRCKKHYFVYNTLNGLTMNISQRIRLPVYDNENSRYISPLSFGIAGWMNHDSAVLIYDRYDIWLVDCEGKNTPVNVTNSYGRKNKTILRLVKSKEGLSELSSLQNNEILLLSAFNCVSKYSGYYNKQLGANIDPKPLTMGPYIYSLPPTLNSHLMYIPFTPFKAKNTDKYIVRRMSSIEAPNLYSTKDFKTFTQLTNIQPQKKYNWMTSSLLHWKMPNGKESQGILYKPENFDPQKKYPVIFFLYEKLTDGLNEFIQPELSDGIINIPYFVSNGYLVFMPDIYYELGNPGSGIYSSVVSAAKYLSSLPWVNSNKIGIQGHSYGGYEVNYLITHTNIFSCAVSCAGLSDLISHYGSLADLGQSLQFQEESGQLRIGETLWKKPDLYLNNSPIFKADKIQTPLLLMHNKNDGAVPWQQSLELFTALRRLGKKVWMLQYNEGTHQLVQKKDMQDFSIRLTQFFDYYLKNAMPPKWMTVGVPAKLREIETGLELDESGKTP